MLYKVGEVRRGGGGGGGGCGRDGISFKDTPLIIIDVLILYSIHSPHRSN